LAQSGSSQKKSSSKHVEKQLDEGTLIVLKNGQRVTKQQRYLEASQLHPTFALLGLV
jgi:hypothetical protein